jgi:hypothetical protein
MNEAEMSAALDAVREEALKLARRDDLPEAVQDGLNLIILLARHRRTSAAKGRRKPREALPADTAAKEGPKE